MASEAAEHSITPKKRLNENQDDEQKGSSSSTKFRRCESQDVFCRPGVCDAAGIEHLSSHLRDRAGIPVLARGAEAPAFQFRCMQIGSMRQVIFAISGAHNLFKLNQTIAECFNVGSGAFQHHPQKGATVPGSHFLISRPLGPAECTSALICNKRTAKKMGFPFIEDRSVPISRLFRGTSTGYALEMSDSEAQQHVEYHSPSLSAPIEIKLEGILPNTREEIDGYHRGRNREPLPRIMGSTFLSEHDIDRKNFAMLGDREQPKYLFRAGESQEAVNRTYTKARRSLLFREDGSDNRWAGFGLPPWLAKKPS